MNYRIIIPAALITFALAAPAFASEISGTITAGSATTTPSGSSGQVSGTVATTTGSSGTVGGTVVSPSSGGSGGSGGSSGGGGGSILAGAGGANPLPGSSPATGSITTTTTTYHPTETITTTPAPRYYSPNIPAATGGAALTAGNSLADNAGTTSPEVFGTNQLAAASTNGSAYLWWVVALAGLAIIGLAWLGYRELA